MGLGLPVLFVVFFSLRHVRMMGFVNIRPSGVSKPHWETGPGKTLSTLSCS